MPAPPLALAIAFSVIETVMPGITEREPAVVLVGAGDIARCGSAADGATAELLDGIGGTIFTTGDNVYPSGTRADFRDCYHPSWGRHRDRTRPSPGNHDYLTPGARGYFRYFDRRAGPNERGYYAYRRGPWRIYSLNSEVLSNAQLAWLRADLSKHRPRCSLAYWHRPLFSSGTHGNAPEMRELWRLLYRGGVEFVVNGHDHDYERFAPMRPSGTRFSRGIRQFVVGTGGASLRPFDTIRPNSVVRHARSHGVLKLRLQDGAYDWRFIAVSGRFDDSGSATCHRRP
jgi:hypothetical protein